MDHFSHFLFKNCAGVGKDQNKLKRGHGWSLECNSELSYSKQVSILAKSGCLQYRRSAVRIQSFALVLITINRIDKTKMKKKRLGMEPVVKYNAFRC